MMKFWGNGDMTKKEMKNTILRLKRKIKKLEKPWIILEPYTTTTTGSGDTWNIVGLS